MIEGRAAIWSPVRLFLIAFSILGALSIAWALATPIYGGPDETAHATKAIAIVRGEFVGVESPDGGFPRIPLPPEFRFDSNSVCFVFDSGRPADCGASVGGEAGADWQGNWVLRNNPVYYWLVGWPSLLIGHEAGIYAMRVVGGLLGAALLALAFPIALRRGSRWMPFAMAFAASPMITFIGGTVNPQGPEIAGGLVTWIALFRLLEAYRDGGPGIRGDRWLQAAIVLGSFFLLTSRFLGPLWWVVILAVAVLACGWRSFVSFLRDRAAWPWIAVVLAFALLAVAWTFGAGSLGTQASEGDGLPGLELSPLGGIWAVLRATPVYVQQAIGIFGWLDTPLDGTVLALYLGSALLLVAVAVSATTRRGAWLVGGVVALAIILPALVQGLTVSRTGLIWQGRYSLWLYLGIVVVAAWALDRWSASRADFLAVRFTAIGAVLLGCYQVVAFAFVLYRYVVGTRATVGDLFSKPAWQPPLGWPTLLLLATAATAAYTWFIVAAARRARILLTVRE